MKNILQIAIFSHTFLLMINCAKSQCIYHAAQAGNDPAVTYTLTGGSFQSFGCAPIDPTYWVSGSGAVMTVTFTVPQSYPSFRVWGMNDDDSASVSVNGLAYPLSLSSAWYDPKVICGQSPGPDGVAFANGKLVGANSNATGNYSYQNVSILASNVTSITVNAVSGAGWGYVGSSTDCPPLGLTAFHRQSSLNVIPNPASGIISLTGVPQNQDVLILNALGMCVQKTKAINSLIDISNLTPGFYFIKIQINGQVIIKPVIKI